MNISNFTDIALKIFKHCKDDHRIETDILGFLANSPSAFDGTMQPVIRRLLHTSRFFAGKSVIYYGPLGSFSSIYI